MRSELFSLNVTIVLNVSGRPYGQQWLGMWSFDDDIGLLLSTVPADGLAPLGASLPAGTMMNDKYEENLSGKMD